MEQSVSVERAIKNAAHSVEMEGFTVTDEYKELCLKLIRKDISMEQYIEAVTRKNPS